MILLKHLINSFILIKMELKKTSSAIFLFFYQLFYIVILKQTIVVNLIHSLAIPEKHLDRKTKLILLLKAKYYAFLMLNKCVAFVLKYFSLSSLKVRRCYLFLPV